MTNKQLEKIVKRRLADNRRAERKPWSYYTLGKMTGIRPNQFTMELHGAKHLKKVRAILEQVAVTGTVNGDTSA